LALREKTCRSNDEARVVCQNSPCISFLAHPSAMDDPSDSAFLPFDAGGDPLSLLPAFEPDSIVPVPAPEGDSKVPCSAARKVPCSAARKRKAEDCAHDFPEPSLPLPPDISLRVATLITGFSLRCQVDLKRLAFEARNSEHNPRRAPNTVLRLIQPKATAKVYAQGTVTMHGMIDEETARQAARRVARIVQTCGHPEAKCAGFAVLNVNARSDLRFAVRLEQFAQHWHRALYEPESCHMVMIQTRDPHVTLMCAASGKLQLDAKSLEDAQEALRRSYPAFHEFRA